MYRTQFAVRKLKVSAEVPLVQTAGWRLVKSNSIILIFLILGRKQLLKVLKELCGIKSKSFTMNWIQRRKLELNAQHC